MVGGLDKTPVQVGDRAGFVVNPLLLGYLNHAVRLLETGHATREDIDKAATCGVGPLVLLDLIGLDTSLSVLEALQAEFGGSRLAPAPLLRRLAEAGLAGRKSGCGFYQYQEKSVHAAPAARMVEDGYATAADIDTAMVLGCGYPSGPLEMLDDIGPAAHLAGSAAWSADPAFAPAPLLAEHAAAGTRLRG